MSDSIPLPRKLGRRHFRFASLCLGKWQSQSQSLWSAPRDWLPWAPWLVRPGIRGGEFCDVPSACLAGSHGAIVAAAHDLRASLQNRPCAGCFNLGAERMFSDQNARAHCGWLDLAALNILARPAWLEGY